MVSGDLIPNWLWFEEMNENLSQVSEEGEQGGEPTGWGLFFTSFRDSLREQSEEQEAALNAAEALAPRYQEAVQQTDTTVFIHLRDARVYQPGQSALPANGMYWRGRLSEVSGWSFGKLSS